jgi:methylated-DNA-[protein]-cysteine S-methyltransferase
MPSPLGPLLLCGTATAITAIFMATRKHPEGVPSDTRPDDGPFREAKRQLDAYFGGELREFTLALAPPGTLFRQKVWRALLDIPYGSTESYGALALRIGLPQAARAVGLANGRNPISIVVPCHRVVAGTGHLTGFGGGIENKAWLLAHERSVLEGVDQLPLA